MTARRTALDRVGLLTRGVRTLVWANVGVFLFTAAIPSAGFFRILGLTPQLVVTRFWVWQPATYMFLHGSFTHILFNMLWLWMVGVQLDRIWGTRLFLRFCFVTGIGAALFTVAAATLLPFSFASG